MGNKGVVIETCFDPADGHPFITVEEFRDLSMFYPGASFRIGKAVVEKTEEGAEANGKEIIQLLEISSHTKALVFVKLGSLKQIRPGDLFDLI